ncbi:hypothetical protein D3C76_1120100 [compost metagenome]
MTQSEFFKSLGAPLKNTRWSWGARRSDGALVLRIWKDRTKEFDGHPFAAQGEHEMWKKKLKLNGGDTLHSGRHYQKGSMAEEDVYEYTILNA